MPIESFFVVMATWVVLICIWVFAMARNNWVYQRQIDPSIHFKLASYDEMYDKWWIWDVKRFRIDSSSENQ